MVSIFPHIPSRPMTHLPIPQVHRESQTGDAVQLNMIHGTHFQASSNDAFPDGKLWGPWLWYLVRPSPSFPLSFAHH